MDFQSAFPSNVSQDLEGLTTMRNIGKNMAWLIKSIALAKENGLDHPASKKVFTNFIR
ncbi:MAG: hypothetical protein LBC41_05400 [Clostridiales bacterium]|nr:hypothetical protein [Clostridiales bacterium]